jgi:hypothetical protein
MEQNLIQQLIDVVTKTAPELWRIGRTQVLAINIQDFIIGVIFLVVVIFTINLIKKLRDKDDLNRTFNHNTEKYEYTNKEKDCIYVEEIGVLKAIGWIVNGILSIFIMCNFVSIIMRLFNPDYYALKVLLDLIQ